MTARTAWDAAADKRLLALRWAGLTWDGIAQEMGRGRYVVLERGRRLGARRCPPLPRAVTEAADRAPRPAGHPQTWALLTAGTLLDGAAYPYPVFL